MLADMNSRYREAAGSTDDGASLSDSLVGVCCHLDGARARMYTHFLWWIQ